MFICSKCGREFHNKEAIIIMGSEKEEILCEQCNILFHSCADCANRDSCNFETVKDGIPKTVIKRMKHPVMGIVEQEIINPERVEKHCKTCICGGEHGVCVKSAQHCIPSCVNWKEEKNSKWIFNK